MYRLQWGPEDVFLLELQFFSILLERCPHFRGCYGERQRERERERERGREGGREGERERDSVFYSRLCSLPKIVW